MVSSFELLSVAPRFKTQPSMGPVLTGVLRGFPHSFQLIVCALCQAGSRRPLTAEARLQIRLSPYDIWSCTGRAHGNSVFPSLYHPTIAPPPFLHLSPTTCKYSQPISASLNNKYCSVQRQNMLCTWFRIPS